MTKIEERNIKKSNKTHYHCVGDCQLLYYFFFILFLILIFQLDFTFNIILY